MTLQRLAVLLRSAHTPTSCCAHRRCIAPPATRERQAWANPERGEAKATNGNARSRGRARLGCRTANEGRFLSRNATARSSPVSLQCSDGTAERAIPLINEASPPKQIRAPNQGTETNDNDFVSCFPRPFPAFFVYKVLFSFTAWHQFDILIIVSLLQITLLNVPTFFNLIN